MRSLFIICLVCVCSFSFSQDQALVDSLNREIKKAAHDSIKIRLLNELSAHYLFTNTVGTREPALKALELSQKNNNVKGIMNSCIRLGVMFYRLGGYDSSIVFYNKGIRYAETEKDTTFILKFKANIALSLSSQGKYKEALDVYYKILNLQEKVNPQTAAKNYLDIASIYYHLNDFETAFKMATEAKNRAEKFNDQKTLANAYGSLGVFLHSMGKLDEALKCHNISYSMKKEQGDLSGQINSLINIGIILEDKKDFRGSLSITDSVIILAKETGATKQLANVMTNRGSLFSNLEQYDKAYEAFKEALVLYTEINSLKDIYETTEKLGYNAIRRKKFEEAAMYLKDGLNLKDSLYKMNMADAIAEMRTKFDTEKKEQENLRLAKENELQLFKLESEKQMRLTQLWMAIVGGFLLICIFALVIFRFRAKKKAELERQMAVQKNLGLKAVIEAEEKERIRIAKDLHDGLGQLLSTARVNMAALEGEVKKEDEQILNNALNVIDDSIKEVRNISHNMMPVALIEFGLIKAVDILVMRVNEARAMTIKFNHGGIERLEQSVEISIYRIIQEVLNNMIKHSDAKNIMKDLQRSGTKILLKINDDGKGFDTGDIGKSRGIGWNNIYSRLSVINGKMDIKSEPGAGTVINIDFSV